MERSEVSRHEVSLFRSLSREWATSRQLAQKARIAPRTARHHLLRMVKIGVVEVAETFPAHGYRLVSKADGRGRAYIERVVRAMEVFK